MSELKNISDVFGQIKKQYDIEPKTDRQKMFANQGNAVEGCFPGYENEEWAAVKYSDGTWHGKGAEKVNG